MKYGEYTLPQRFVKLATFGQLSPTRSTGIWQLTREADAYGAKFETDIAKIHADQNAIEKATAELPFNFPELYYCELDAEERAAYRHGYGELFIPDIKDWTGIVCFGESRAGHPFCFDFRETPSQPSVIWWDYIYWRRIAPNFSCFIDLFDLTAY